MGQNTCTSSTVFRRVTTQVWEALLALRARPEAVYVQPAAPDLAEEVFTALYDGCSGFLDVVAGRLQGDALGMPDYHRSMSFPLRFLKSDSIDSLPEPLRLPLDAAITDTFFLGLVWHLSDTTHPDRHRYAEVELPRLFSRWHLEALIANLRMRPYEENPETLCPRVYEYHFQHRLEPLLKPYVRPWWWKSGMCRSFFHNLFLSGAQLGMMCDVAAINPSYTAIISSPSDSGFVIPARLFPSDEQSSPAPDTRHISCIVSSRISISF